MGLGWSIGYSFVLGTTSPLTIKANTVKTPHELSIVLFKFVSNPQFSMPSLGSRNGFLQAWQQ